MKQTSKKPEIILILNDIRSVYNVGSIFRTADASGVSKIFLVGITPAPIDRFGRARKDLQKVALGAEISVPWEAEPKILSLIKKLKKQGVKIVSVELSPESIDYRKLKTTNKIAFIVGNEVEGIPKKVLDASDEICEILMAGKKESLNVGVATGIILFSVTK